MTRPVITKPDTSTDAIWKKNKYDYLDFKDNQKEAIRSLEAIQKSRPLKPPGKK